MIQMKQAPALFGQIVDCAPVELSDSVYQNRVKLLVERLRQRGLTHAVIYGDREHASHIEYFSKYDCRFEEGLLIVGADAACHLLVGNEGMGFSAIVPYKIQRHLYQNFSLQGQPRSASKKLTDILSDCGLNCDARVGVVGIKYFEQSPVDGSPETTYDLPEYIVRALRQSSGEMRNFTEELTGYPNGIRMTVRDAEEIVWAEAAANRTAAVVQRMFQNVRTGMKEYELPMLCRVGFDPHSMHPICNFGDRSVMLGMASPGTSVLNEGDPCGFCYGIRGSLTSRVGIAARDMDSVRADLRPYVQSFYAAHFGAVAAWYETLCIGVTGGELYDSVMSRIGGQEFGVALNPGHFIAAEEWTNSISAKGCLTKIIENTLLQSDIIASGSDPTRTSICEDGVAVADGRMRAELSSRFPEVYARMLARREAMAEIGIALHEEVLPLSNLNGAYYPFMLNNDIVFSK